MKEIVIFRNNGIIKVRHTSTSLPTYGTVHHVLLLAVGLVHQSHFFY